MERSKEGKCPYCNGSMEYFPEPDGACEYYCNYCGWREYVPSDQDISTAKAQQKETDQPSTPIIVVFIDGGTIVAVEGDAAIRVIICDYDATDNLEEINGESYSLDVWPLEEPSKEFKEVLNIMDCREKQNE